MQFLGLFKYLPTFKDALNNTWLGATLGGVKTNDNKDAAVVVTASLPDRIMKDVNANGFTYYGHAPYGSALTDPVWVIEREQNGNWVTSAPNVKWTDRTTIQYNNGVA